MIDRHAEFLISSVAWQGIRHSEAIAEIRAAGFGGAEVLCKPGHFEPGDRVHVEDVLSALREWPDAVVTFHAPFYGVDLAASDPDAWDHSLRETMLALDVASEIGAGNMTVHVRGRETMKGWDNSNLEAIRRSLDVLASAAAERKMTLAVENLPPPCFTADETDLLSLIDGYPTDLVGACIDTGHAHLDGRLVGLAGLIASRAFVTHLHDNSACEKDEHRIPGGGTIPWMEFVESMRGFCGKRVVEVVRTGTLGETLDSVKKAIAATGLSGL